MSEIPPNVGNLGAGYVYVSGEAPEVTLAGLEGKTPDKYQKEIAQDKGLEGMLTAQSEMIGKKDKAEQKKYLQELKTKEQVKAERATKRPQERRFVVENQAAQALAVEGGAAKKIRYPV